jgi:AcrR family transcriptional regulator
MPVAKIDKFDPHSRRDKFAERREELADAALKTLAELGYARTSLREIAQNSEFSHGVLHYYFADKDDLILCGVRQYKAHCVTRYDDVIASAKTSRALLEGFLDALVQTVREDARLHRLWYDIRAQAMFEKAFRGDIAEIEKSLENMIWRLVQRYAELSRSSIGCEPATIYGAIDGLFQLALLKHLSGDSKATGDLCDGVRTVLLGVMKPASASKIKR